MSLPFGAAFAAHIAMVVGIYYLRATSVTGLPHSDALLFGVVPALALTAYVLIVVLRGIGRTLTRFASAALALSLVFLGQWLGMVIALNIWVA